MINNFNEKPNFPVTYGDQDIENEKRFSDYVVIAAKNERVQKHIAAVAVAVFTLGMYTQPASAIPPEYGEAANEILNQAAENGVGAGGIPAVPPIGEIHGHVPQVNQHYNIPAMPIEQQRLIVAQQRGQIGEIGAMPEGPRIGQLGPTSPPSFYLPDKPRKVGPRAINTVAFAASIRVICLNAVWGEPVAIVMCSSGLMGIAYTIGKKVVIMMANNLK